MYTIKRAAQVTGVPEATLRAWERRYGVFSPQRTASGYRLYDQESLAVISTMHRLIGEGWSPSAAADALRDGTRTASLEAGTHDAPGSAPAQQNGATYARQFLEAAVRMDVAGIEASLDGGFSLGSFERVVDTWLFPTLVALGDGWARGEIDVAGEHAASHAVHRRLSAAYDAAGGSSRGPGIVVGLPSGSQHELGALAFATALRRRGFNVLYLGANVPLGSWETAVRSHSAEAAVLAVVTPDDRPAASSVAEHLARHELPVLVCTGGAAGADLGEGVRHLASDIGTAADELDRLTHE